MPPINSDNLPNLGELVRKRLRAEWVEYAKEHWEEEFERPDALLTDKQRRFILGLVEYSGKNPRQQRYQMRERIRRRFVDGLQDLSLLSELDENSKEKIADELGDSGLHLAGADFLEYVYATTGQRELLKQIIRTAVYNAEFQDAELGDADVKPGSVSVEISVEYPPNYEDLHKRYQERGLSSLQPEEIGHLVADHRLDPEDLQQYYEGKDDLAEEEGELFDGVEYPKHPKSFDAERYEHDDE